MYQSYAQSLTNLRTSWPMGMAERGRVLPGLIVLAFPELMWSPGRTPCGANTYEKPLKSPPGEPASSFHVIIWDDDWISSHIMIKMTSICNDMSHGRWYWCGLTRLSKTVPGAMQAGRCIRIFEHKCTAPGMVTFRILYKRNACTPVWIVLQALHYSRHCCRVATWGAFEINLSGRQCSISFCGRLPAPEDYKDCSIVASLSSCNNLTGTGCRCSACSTMPRHLECAQSQQLTWR